MLILIIIGLASFVVISALLSSRRSFVNNIWFVDAGERQWFYWQCSENYEALQKSVVLYALRILSGRFDVPLTKLRADMTLIALFHATYELTFRHRLHKYVGIVPDFKNPLQRVNDDFEVANESMRQHKMPLFQRRANMTVKDYVRFIVDLDKWMQQYEMIRCTAYFEKICRPCLRRVAGDGQLQPDGRSGMAVLT